MNRTEFIAKEYEILSQRVASADAYSATFVSIYLVFQAALFTGLNLSLGFAAQNKIQIQILYSDFQVWDFLALFGIITTM